ncbi:MAG: hypothetical protein CMB80_00435 [Flammeovirgaceae bacterium]|jgi:aspartate oxidase|nr:hypothetical protein [Flammeovirgaceae bacterium]|tara:strand:- start:1791 stop:2087 length:297 start_codon:yes stop_codon:yes gene_type:complete
MIEQMIEIAKSYGIPGLVILGIGWTYWKERKYSNTREKAHREERIGYEKGHSIERGQWRELAERQIESEEKKQTALIDVINRNNDALTGVREEIARKK